MAARAGIVPMSRVGGGGGGGPPNHSQSNWEGSHTNQYNNRPMNRYNKGDGGGGSSSGYGNYQVTERFSAGLWLMLVVLSSVFAKGLYNFGVGFTVEHFFVG